MRNRAQRAADAEQRARARGLRRDRSRRPAGRLARCALPGERPGHQATTAHFQAVYPAVAEAGLGDRGVYIGRDMHGGSFVYDPWVLYARGVLNDANTLVIGRPDFGKSSLSKTWLLRSRVFGRRGEIVDLKGEYEPLVRALGGTILRLTPGGRTRLNPLTRIGRRELREGLLEAIARAMLARPLTQAEAIGLSAALQEADHRHDGAEVCIPDVIQELRAPTTALAGRLGAANDSVQIELREVARALQRLCHGPLRGMFDGPTTAGEHVFDAPVISLDLSEIAEGVAAVNLPIAIAMVCAVAFLDANRIERAERARQSGRELEKTIRINDEAWRALPIAGLGDYYQAAFKLSRKTGVQHWLVLHRISDLRSAGDEGTRQQRLAEGLLADASTTIVYRQHAQEIPLTTDALGLSETERQLIGSLDQGVALWRAGGRAVVRDPPPPLRPRVGADRHRPGNGPKTRHAHGEDHMRAGADDRAWPLASLCAALAAALAFAILASALAGLLGHADPIWVAPAAAGTLLAQLVSHLSDPALAWPATDRRRLPGTAELQAALVISLIAVAAACGCAWLLVRRLRDAAPRKRSANWATRSDLAELRVRRPERGRIPLGYHRRGLIAAEERASVMVVGPSQSGKTTGLVVPAMNEWNGPVLATSTKADVLVHTLPARSELGEARVFDPTGATSLGHAVWSPLTASTTWTGAHRTAAALLGVGDRGTNRSADDSFWRPARARYLAALLYAATKTADLTIADVLHWIATSEFDEPTKLLDGSGRGDITPAIDSIQSVKGSDHRFASSLLQTIATALDPWQEPQVAGATMGQSRISADWLLDSTNTLYIVAPADDQRRLSGLFTALVSHIVAGAYERSAKTGRPIEPALLLALDEVANIAPLPNLDEIASTGPGQGVHLLCVLQNISQSYDRWGRDRAETIIANHRARLFCSGIGDRATLDYLRSTLGEEEIARISTQQRGIAVPGNRTHSTEHRPLATPHRIRQANLSQSLLVYGRLAPAWITLRARHNAADRPASGARRREASNGKPRRGKTSTRDATHEQQP